MTVNVVLEHFLCYLAFKPERSAHPQHCCDRALRTSLPSSCRLATRPTDLLMIC
jgi:hypothetical protein